MALSLGKLTILIGAGILGSVLAKEGRVSDVFSGALKIAWKQIKRNDQTPSVKKPPSDSLMAQMNSLRQELQMMASNRSVTIVTASRAGTSRYGIIIVVVVAGSGYFWWKGWKLPDMMFATRRSLSDACSSVAQQLQNVYSSASVTKRALSSKMDRVDHTLAESIENSSSTKIEVIELKGKTERIGTSFMQVRDKLESLETKLNRFEGEQARLAGGIWELCDFAIHDLQESSSISFSPIPELPPPSPTFMVTPPQSSRGLLKLSPSSPSRDSRWIGALSVSGSKVSVSGSKVLCSMLSVNQTESLPPVFESEGGRASYNGFRKGNNGILDAVGTSNSDEDHTPEDTYNASSTPSHSRFRFSSPSAILRRTRSAASGMVQTKRSSSEPSTEQK